jgi:hypothetical protein
MRGLPLAVPEIEFFHGESCGAAEVKHPILAKRESIRSASLRKNCAILRVCAARDIALKDVSARTHILKFPQSQQDGRLAIASFA